MTTKNILLLLAFTLVTSNCSFQKKEKEALSSPIVLEDQAETNPMISSFSKMSYNFTATVNQSRIINKGRGAATGKFPVKQLIATVVTVTKGADISVGQQIFIELATQQTSCNPGSTCHFIAPYKHPANKKIVQLLKAQVIP